VAYSQLRLFRYFLRTEYSVDLGGSHLGSLSNKRCQTSVITICVFGIVSFAVANGLALLKVSALWDNRRKPMIALAVGYMATYSISAAFIVRRFIDNVVYMNLPEYNFNSCSVNIKSKALIAVWTPMVAMDSFTLIFLLLNSLHRPRGMNVNLFKQLCRDGLLFFTTTWSVRLLGLFISLFAPLYLSFAELCVGWSLVTTLVSRLLLSLYMLDELVEHKGLEDGSSALRHANILQSDPLLPTC